MNYVLPASLVCYFADIEDTADIRMRDLPRQANFAGETLARLVGLCQRPRQKFQRHRLPKLQVFRAIDFAHPAFA